jgi:hypothetical protein
MTDQSYVHVVVLADRSGSMQTPTEAGSTRAADATRGVHEFVKEQRLFPGRTTFTMVEFNHAQHVVEDFDTGAMSLAWECAAAGSTALQDALADTITKTGERLAALPEDHRPGRVFVVVVTDGEENASQRYQGAQGTARLKDMVEHQRAVYGWDFTFLSAGLDAFTTGASYGVPLAATAQTSGDTVYDTFAVASAAVSEARAWNMPVAYNLAQRKQMAGGKGDDDQDDSK